MWSTHRHLARICRRTCQPREVVACRVPREAGLGTAPAFLPHPGQAGGARLRRQVDQAPYCSSWMRQKYRVGLEAAFWWHRNWWLSLSSSGLTLNECDACRLQLCNPGTARAPSWRSRKGVLKSGTKARSSLLALLRTGRNRWISPNNVSAFSLLVHLTRDRASTGN
jgi:hypothetical protein